MSATNPAQAHGHQRQRVRRSPLRSEARTAWLVFTGPWPMHLLWAWEAFCLGNLFQIWLRA